MMVWYMKIVSIDVDYYKKYHRKYINDIEKLNMFVKFRSPATNKTFVLSLIDIKQLHLHATNRILSDNRK